MSASSGFVLVFGSASATQRWRCGVRRRIVAAKAHLRAVEEPVVIAVRIEGVDEAVAVAVLVVSRLGAVGHAVVIGVRIERIGTGRALDHIRKSVVIAVEGACVRAAIDAGVGVAGQDGALSRRPCCWQGPDQPPPSSR